MEQACRQIIRALRGTRSQVQLSRRLGYRSNVVADWEGGHRSPDAVELIRVAEVVGVDVAAAVEDFHPRSASAYGPDPAGVAGWLQALRGSTTLADIAARTGASRHQVGRWLRGNATPRVPDFLRLVDALTGRAPQFVAGLVSIEAVPALVARWEASELSRDLAWREPWVIPMFAFIESGLPAADAVEVLARRFGHPEADVSRRLRLLQQAGLIHRVGSEWQVAQAPSIEVPSGEQRAFRRFWIDEARARMDRPGDLVAFNVFGVSREDLQKVQAIQRAAFREMRSLIAASSPVETVGLVVMHTCDLAPE